MEKAAQSMPAEPSETVERIRCSGASGRPRCWRMLRMIARKSSTVSSRVPSRSNSTASSMSDTALTVNHVVHVHVLGQFVVAQQRVVGQADDVLHVQSGLPCPLAQLGRANELGVFVGAPGQHAQQVLGTDNGEGKGLGVAVDGGKEYMAAGLDQGGAGADHRRWIGYVLEHLHAGHHIE